MEIFLFSIFLFIQLLLFWCVEGVGLGFSLVVDFVSDDCSLGFIGIYK